MQIQEDSIVLVHDAVRSMVSVDLIQRSLIEVIDKKAIIPAISSKDSVRLLDGEKNKSISRESVMLVQTPQTFYSVDLKKAFEVDENHNAPGFECSSMWDGPPGGVLALWPQ